MTSQDWTESSQDSLTSKAMVCVPEKIFLYKNSYMISQHWWKLYLIKYDFIVFEKQIFASLPVFLTHYSQGNHSAPSVLICIKIHSMVGEKSVLYIF